MKTDSSVKPTTIMNADSRFGTTFLSTKYRDHAVAGEVLMDKTTGELFIKRVSDGKIVSFYQNKKILNDLAFDIRMLLLDNEAFSFPSMNEDAFFISTNYDLVAINNESLINLITDNVSIPGEPAPINKLRFNVSGQCNGFFCRHTTRDTDRAFIEFLTNQYNTLFKTYEGNNAVYTEEANKFIEIPKWETSNAVLKYDLKVYYNDDTSAVYTDNTDYLMMNDDSIVFFPENIYQEGKEILCFDVTIKSIEYDKIHFMVNHKDEFGTIFTESYNKLIATDGRADVSEFNISYFCEDISLMEIFGNEEIVGFLSMFHYNRYSEKMTKFLGNSQIKISQEKPSSACIWFKPNKN